MFFEEYHRQENQTVLDVGAGLGRSKERIGNLTTQDTCVGLDVDIHEPLEMITERWDWVTAFDVIEHVPNDIRFLYNMLEHCNYGVFITTPNFAVSKCANEYHVREYLPLQFKQLLRTVFWHSVLFFSGSPDGTSINLHHVTTFDRTTDPHLAMLIRK